MTPVVHLELRISPRISKKFEIALMRYSRAWGKLNHEKTKKPEVENLVALSLQQLSKESCPSVETKILL
jgi:hypothetical protein